MEHAQAHSGNQSESAALSMLTAKLRGPGIDLYADAALCLGLHAMTDASQTYNAHGQSQMQHDNSGVQKAGIKI